MRTFRRWVKKREHPAADLIYRAAKAAQRAQVPSCRPVHLPLYHARGLFMSLTEAARRSLWWTPLFQARLVRPAPGLFLFGGIPQVLGPLEIEVGENCRISGQTTFSGRSSGKAAPRLTIGRNVEIGWQTGISVGTSVSLGNNVLIAGRCYLAGYSGHPLDPEARARHEPDTESQVGDIVLEDDVWLASGVTVLAGVRVGKGSVVTAGSVVYRNIPPGSIATGNPARVVGPVVPAAP